MSLNYAPPPPSSVFSAFFNSVDYTQIQRNPVSTQSGAGRGYLNTPLSKRTADCLYMKTKGDVSTTLTVKVDGIITSSQPRWSMYRNSAAPNNMPSTYVNYNAEHISAVGVSTNLSAGTVDIQVAGRYFISFASYSDTPGNFSSYKLSKNGLYTNTFVRCYSDKSSGFHKGGLNLYCILDLAVNDSLQIIIEPTTTKPWYNDNVYWSGCMIG